MMNDIAIRVENLSKRYRIGLKDQMHDTFAGAVMAFIKRPIKNLRNLRRLSSFDENGSSVEDVLWALRDVSFDVKQGEVVGIIGRNGAGKSTLLKVISRITEPTSGRITMRGRVSSLLEVGTGFHPELTGRENIFLNGTILGMRKKEIDRKFDEIVDFSGVEKFIDTPVKRYSSGMRVRLAFSVAAHLEPEILVVDEVLSVGDAAFQKKSLAKMEGVANEGRTVFFVSHHMAAISTLCMKAMVLKDGTIDFPIGPTDEAVHHYLLEGNQVPEVLLADRSDRSGEGKIRITGFETFDGEGNKQMSILPGRDIELRIHYECVDNNVPKNVTAAISISSSMGAFMTVLSNKFATSPFPTIAPKGSVGCYIPKFPLFPGRYKLNLLIRQNDIIQDWIQEAVTLDVESGDFYATGVLPPQKSGGVFLEQKWSLY